ncbi:cell surface protein [Archangium lipolyticum]|uniref:cell surface protein n=1 Tax=Archangium lipolyticum TaxID=2970465 RepID=UPI002149E456|nr:cell surface protein [Archangium lipolyticum]
MRTHGTVARWSAWLVMPLLAVGCGAPSEEEPPQALVCTSDNEPFADKVVSFSPGEDAGFGQDGYPDIVLGPPHGAGAGMGSLDVLSLGRGGEIVLELTDIGVVDGPGVDLLVFENAFGYFAETGVVAVSEDGQTWHEFPCDSANRAGGYPGCAGVKPVSSSPENGISPTDPAVAGGDGFDLSTLGVARARFVRIRDTGSNSYGSSAGGFDLDAVAVVNGSPVCEWK